MRPDCVRRHRAVDIIQLGCVAGVAVVTWAAVPYASGDVAWKHCLIVSVTTLLALAAVTPHESRSVWIRLVMSGWLAIAPFLAAFEGMPAARWAYWIAGSLIAVLSMLALLPAASSSDQSYMLGLTRRMGRQSCLRQASLVLGSENPRCSQEGGVMQIIPSASLRSVSWQVCPMAGALSSHRQGACFLLPAFKPSDAGVGSCPHSMAIMGTTLQPSRQPGCGRAPTSGEAHGWLLPTRGWIQPTGMVITGSCWVFSPSASDRRWTMKAKIVFD